MNTYNMSVLRWNELMSPKMYGKDILITYPVEGSTVPEMIIAKVKGTDYIGREHCLLVDDGDDIRIILREGKGRTWEAYLLLGGL